MSVSLWFDAYSRSGLFTADPLFEQIRFIDRYGSQNRGSGYQLPSYQGGRFNGPMNHWQVDFRENPDDVVLDVVWRRHDGTVVSEEINTGKSRRPMQIYFPEPSRPYPPLPRVRLLLPDDRTVFPNGETVPIVFVSEAYDIDGSMLSGSSIQWEKTAGWIQVPPRYYPAGQGQSVSMTLPQVIDSELTRYAIRVTATSRIAPTRISDGVSIFVGRT